MKKIIIMFFCFIFLAGCSWTSWYQSASSGRVGCAPDEIEISNSRSDNWGNSSWTATCKGKRYFCSITQLGAAGSKSSATSFACSPEIK